MELKSGDKVYYRISQETEKYGATVVSMYDEDIVLEVFKEAHPNFSAGQYLRISGPDYEYYTEVIDINGNVLRLKRMWTEKREYFRIDDVFPVIVSKSAEDSPCKKTRILSGYGMDISETDVPDDSISPRLWKMLVDINTKLKLIMERLQLEKEGLVKAPQKEVNLSASGIRFVVDEKIEVGDTVEVKMLLPTCPPVGINTFGTAVRVKEMGNGKYELALRFADIDDEIRDEIIQYTIKRQREIIRKKRKQKGNDV
ncbi:MAG: PilZ domain-containing protein [Thermodesulfovibrionales bacterium]|nr:PilZ domain-containing protein [Thermodesulfovibrionales bacterium]